MDAHKKKNSLWSNLKALFFGVFIALLLVEIILRVFHPIPFRIKHGKIVLPANQKLTRENSYSKKLEPAIYYSRNSIGLRGEEYPKDPQHFIKIVTIGGSTTECSYNSDSLTWAEVMKRELKQKINANIWVNNAGLDGTSTMGHLLMLQEHIIPLHPDYVLFLVGLNDTENDTEHNFDIYHSTGINTNSIKEFFRSLIKKTETGALLENLYRYRLAYNKGLVHREVDYSKQEKLDIDSSAIAKRLAAQSPYLVAYKKRVLGLDSVCRTNHIKAIFLTQPALFGSFTDPQTGIDFSELKTWENKNASLDGKILELYNNVLLELQRDGKITAINMAQAMPKNSKLYYDFTHYTTEGTQVFGGKLSDSLLQYIK
jgi:lysophospholipase L1-like esterase